LPTTKYFKALLDLSEKIFYKNFPDCKKLIDAKLYHKTDPVG